MGKHSRLPASGSSRWINCPGSVGLARRLCPGQRPSSVYAMEGTAAHSLLERCMTDGTVPAAHIGKVVHVHELDEKDPVISQPGLFTPAPGWHEFPVDDEMAEGVQMLLDDFFSVQRALDALDTQYEALSETFVELPQVHPDVGGSVDAALVTRDVTAGPGNWIYAWDLKYGRGVVVEVRGNTQLKTYALGLMYRHGLEGFGGATVTIVQPRAEHADGPVRRVDYTKAELAAFSNELALAAKMTEANDPPVRAGDHCTFCPVKVRPDLPNGVCPALEDKAHEDAGIEFGQLEAFEASNLPTYAGDVRDLGERLARARRWVDVLDAWSREVEGMIQRELEAGRSVPGWKLVPKRTNRQWLNEEWTEEALLKAGFGQSEIYHEPKMLSPAQMEKLAHPLDARGHKVAKELIKGLVGRPEGGLTVAPESDKREAVDAHARAIEDFGGLE